jgi:hypothetical protein
MYKKLFSFLAIISMSAILFISFGCAADISPDEFLETEREVEPIGTFDVSKIDAVSKDTAVTTGEIVWQIKNAEDLGTNIVSTDAVFEARVGKIIQLDFEIINNSEEERILYDLNLIDNRGRVFSICLPAYGTFGSEKACALQTIIPGINYEFLAPFDIATDSEGLILEVTDLKFPAEETAYIDLGI